LYTALQDPKDGRLPNAIGKTGCQEDAQELLVYILECLEKEAIECLSELDYENSKDRYFISNIFCGEFATHSQTGVNKEPFYTLPLDIQVCC
jgi:hypothetical protein